MQEMRSSTTLDWPAGIGQWRALEVGVDASWGIDAFGCLPRSRGAVNAYAGVTAEVWRPVLVSPPPEIAFEYVMLRSGLQFVASAQSNMPSEGVRRRPDICVVVRRPAPAAAR